ncbi:MAG TPA: immunoglobulin domain-containing protein [Verrucomicrobiae bacterium]
MRNVRILTLACCTAGLLCSPGFGQAANLTTTNTVGANTGWNTANIWKTNGTGPTVTGPVAGNTYECVFNGNPFGASTSNTRMRNLYASTSPLFQTFPGDSLTLNTNTEFRFKAVSGTAPTVNFPGVGGNPGLILNGGVLNVGDNMVLPIAGKIQAAPGSLSFICPGDNGAGPTPQNNRTFNILGDLSGNGTIVIFQSPGVNPQQISGNANTFSGEWIVKAGWLQGGGANSLGTGNITCDPNYAVPLDPAIVGGITFIMGPAIVEPMYDHNSPGTLTLVNGGQMRLHQNCAFTGVTIEGIPLSPGTHYYSELAANFAANFPAGGSGALTVQPYGQLPVIIVRQPLPQIMIYEGRTVRITATASGPGTITYQWRKNGANLTDSGNISGATTSTLTISGLTASDQASYTVEASNGSSTTVSAACNLTVVAPSGETYEAAVIAANPAVYYRLNETADPVTSPPAFDYAGGGVGTYGTEVQNGGSSIPILGPSAAQGFSGFGANNKAAQFTSMMPASRITAQPFRLNTNAVTITAWINPTTAQTPSAGVVFCRGSGTVAGLNFTPSGATLGYTWNNEGETWRWDSGITPPSAQWTFVALVVSPTNATIYSMNANGALQASRPYNHVIQNFAGTTMIGDDPIDTTGNRVFNGVIDDVAVFAGALTKEQLMGLYAAAGGATTIAPQIALVQPAFQTQYRGQTAQFTVAAGGSEPLTFQWKAAPLFNTAYTNLVEGGRISGSTTATLTISNVEDWDAADYVVAVQNSAGTVISTPANLAIFATTAAENITMSVQQVGGANWDNGADWSDGQPASISAAAKPGSTYELLAGSRMRSPETNRTSRFPGQQLTLRGDSVWVNNPAAGNTTISEIRFKQPNPGRVDFPRLVMNGGQLDVGNDNIVEIGGRIDILTNAPIYNDSGNERGYYIDAWLTGTGTIEYHGYSQAAFNPNYVNNLNIAGTSNTFSGKWNVVLGTLLATGPNSLGTNDISVGAQGAFEPAYDINNPNANLILNGRMYLHQNHTFKSVFVNGMPLNVGTFTFAELNAAYPANFPASWTPQAGATNFTAPSGSITVLVQPAPVISQQPVSVSVYPTENVQFTVVAQGTPPLGYRWRKAGAFLSDAGNLSGSQTPALSISNVVVADAGNYDVVVTNSIGSVTSIVAVLTILPTGPAMNLALDYGGTAIVQPAGNDWNTPNQWTDGRPASLSALAIPGSTYTVPAGARLRSPVNAAASVFPGDILTVNGDGAWMQDSPTAGEIRFKHANPGSVYFKRLVMNGGQLDSGDNGIIAIQGRMDILANTPIYADTGAGQDRPWQIDAWLTGTGSIEYHAFNNSFTGNLNITGTSNTFSGTWNIVQGVLLGSGPNSLGTNTITIGANGALETLYDINNPQGDLILDGQMFLHQNDVFHAVRVSGFDLAPGTYTFAQLNATYPMNFPATWPQQMGSGVSTGSGSITVGQPPRVTLQFQMSGANLQLNWSQGILLEATDLTGPWTTNNAASGVIITPTGPRKFFKIQVQ